MAAPECPASHGRERLCQRPRAEHVDFELFATRGDPVRISQLTTEFRHHPGVVDQQPDISACAARREPRSDE